MAKKLGRPHNFRALSKPKQIPKSQHRHYLPFLPVLLLTIGTILLSISQPLRSHGVLSYATNISSAGLLQSTNKQRQAGGAGDLRLNRALTDAAQAKADDMIARNYWSHTTPDGEQPWAFVDKAGYKYLKAGENLAYGFTTDNATISGWMNSPKHRENLMDVAFNEVGFGFANGPNFNNNGPETVVVAMYGKPQVLGNESTPTALTLVSENTPINSDTAIAEEPSAKPVPRISTVSRGQAPTWSVFVIGAVTGLTLTMILIKHAVGIRRAFRKSERFVLHHPLIDTLLVAIVLAGTFLIQTTGFIR